MKGYGVHLLFHLLALMVGAACGAIAGMWWFGHDEAVRWLALAALVAGILVLTLHGFYIAGSATTWDEVPQARPRPSVRPSQRHDGGTRIQAEPFGGRGRADQDTRTSATEALRERRRT